MTVVQFSSAGVCQIRLNELAAGGVTLARDVAMDLMPGQLTLLSGANGSGKSTFLNALANQKEQSVLVYRPGFGLRASLKVREQARMLAQFAGGAGTVADVNDLLAKVNLLDWAEDAVGGLSSGQKARLGMIPLLVNRSRIWLLDEPLNALDHESLQLLCLCCREHLDRQSVMLIVSHLGQGILRKQFSQYGQSNYVLDTGQVKQVEPPGGHLNGFESSQVEASSATVGIFSFLSRELAVLRSSAGSLLWGGLFFWMVLSFFGLSLLKPEREVALSVVWVSAILSIVLTVKDWFLEDLSSGWLRLIYSLEHNVGRRYWLSKVLVTWVGLVLITIPVVAFAGLQLNLDSQAVWYLAAALVAGLFASVPVLGLIALMVQLTRGGAVLVYILALPMLVPVMIFGLEASQAPFLDRSAWPAINVLLFAGLLGYVAGPWISEKLITLILE